MLTIRIDLLAAVVRFAGKDKDRPHLHGVCIRADEIAATDGSRIVRIDPKRTRKCSISHGEWAQRVVLPRAFVDSLVEVGRVMNASDVQIAMASADKIHAAVGGVEMFYPSAEEMFPPIEQVLLDSLKQRGPEPTRNISIDAAFFADVHAVVQAVAYGKGVSISGWGSKLDPLYLHVEDIVKFVLMPMSTPEAEAEAEGRRL